MTCHFVVVSATWIALFHRVLQISPASANFSIFTKLAFTFVTYRATISQRRYVM